MYLLLSKHQTYLSSKYKTNTLMALIRFCDYTALFAICLQVLSYANQFALQIILNYAYFPGFLAIVAIFNACGAIAFYRANHNWKKCEQVHELNASYCKQCKRKIVARDHHCVFIGQCIDADNFRFYLSFTFFSYTLSMLVLLRVLLDWKTTLFVLYWGTTLPKLSYIYALLSAVFFAIMTGGLFSGSIRRVIQGMTKVDEIKKNKRAKYQVWDLLIKFLRPFALYRQFKQNWQQINGNEFKVRQILMPFL